MTDTDNINCLCVWVIKTPPEPLCHILEPSVTPPVKQFALPGPPGLDCRLITGVKLKHTVGQTVKPGQSCGANIDIYFIFF